MLRLFVGNIPHSANETTLVDFFDSFGFKTGDCQIMRDKMTNHSRGFAFIEVLNPDGAIGKMNGTRMNGRILTVNTADPKKPRESFRK